MKKKNIFSRLGVMIRQAMGVDWRPCHYSHKPNETTLKVIDDVKKGKGLVKAKDTQDLFKKLGI